MDSFGNRLRDSMVLSGVSVSALARHCKVSRTTVQSWRAMREPKLSVGHLLLIDARLKTNLRWLASGKATPIRTYVEEAVVTS